MEGNYDSILFCLFVLGAILVRLFLCVFLHGCNKILVPLIGIGKKGSFKDKAYVSDPSIVVKVRHLSMKTMLVEGNVQWSQNEG